MARVFPKPTYLNDVERRVSPLIEGPAIAAVLASQGRSMGAVAFSSDMYDAAISDEALEAAYAAGVDSNEGAVLASAIVALIIRDEGPDVPVMYGADGVAAVYNHFVAHGCSEPADFDMNTICGVGRVVAGAGCVAGWASPKPSVDAVRAVRFEDVTMPCGSKAWAGIALADEIRLGVSNRATSEAFRAAKAAGLSELDDVTARGFRVSRSRVGEMMRHTTIWAIGQYTVWKVSGVVAVLSATHRANLAAAMYTYANWCIVGANDAADGASAACRTAIGYVHDLVKRDRRLRPWALARYLKSEYAIIVCSLQDSDDADLKDAMLDGLRAESARSKPAGIVREFSDIMGASPASVNYGTIWNVLPPADVDGEAMVEAFQAKTDTIKSANDDAWADFIQYSMMVITAHYIFANRTASIEWASGVAASAWPDWARQCADGTLTYAKEGEYDHMINAIPWVKTIESWYHSAQDVTHVWATDELRVDNELRYALEHAPLLSGVHHPSDVRAAWESGRPVGVRRLYMAGKSENTKFGAKNRETMSADDVAREIISEIDVNLMAIAKVVEGVAMRKGRAGTEAMIKKVLAHGGAKRVLLSLDVSGWSPNMCRRKQMAFVDSMLRMFAIPAAQSASCVFTDLLVSYERAGVSREFLMVDGSVQGFFGTGDSIMHSLLAQWAFRRGKRNGTIDRTARIAKCVLIDDIMCSIDGFTGTMSQVVSHFVAAYKLLGFDVDIVKTLASSSIGTFLNRIYAGRGEHETYAKIGARADREWDRPVVGVREEVSTIYSSYAGAVDRGMDVVAGYTLASIRAMMRVRGLAGRAWAVSDGFAVCTWFAPGGMGGLAVPSVADWICSSGPDNSERAIANCIAIRDACAAGGYTQARDIAGAVNAMLSADTEARAPTTAASDPSAVRLAGVPPCAARVTSALRDAVQRRYPNSAYAAFVTAVPSGADERAWKDVMSDATTPAPVVAALWASTSFAVAESVFKRFTTCQSMLTIMTYSARKKLFRAVRRDDARLLVFIDGLPRSQIRLTAGSSALQALVDREGVCHMVPDVVRPCPADYLRFAPDAERGHATAFVPACADLHVAPQDPLGPRTYASARVIVASGSSEYAKDPMLSAFRRLVTTVSVIAAMGGGASGASALVCATWGFDGSDPSVYAVEASNALRALSNYSRVEHTVRAYPNYAPRIHITCSIGMGATSRVNKNFDWMDTRAFIMAANVVDASCGLAKMAHAQRAREVVRNYVVIASQSIARSTTCGAFAGPKPICARVSGAQACFLYVNNSDARADDEPGQELQMPAINISLHRVSTRRQQRPTNMAAFLESLAGAPGPAAGARAGAELDVAVSQGGSGPAIDAVIVRWMSTFRDMPPALFAERVASGGQELRARLVGSVVGKALWKKIAGRNVDDCAAAMRALAGMVDAGRRSNTVAAWRSERAAVYIARSNDSGRSPTSRYTELFKGHACLELARMSMVTGNVAAAAAIRGFGTATRAIHRRFVERNFEFAADVAADPAEPLLTITTEAIVKAIDINLPEGFAQRAEVLEAARIAWPIVFGWVLDDHSIPEATTARVVASAPPAAASVRSESANALMSAFATVSLTDAAVSEGLSTVPGVKEQGDADV